MTTHITLKASLHVITVMPSFKAAISAFDVQIVKQHQDDQKATIELITDGVSQSNIRHVKNACYAFFDGEVISFSAEQAQP